MKIGSQTTEFQGEFGAQHETNQTKQKKWKKIPRTGPEPEHDSQPG